MEKKLYRSKENKMLAGVCGGIAEYIGIDATILRLAVAIFSLATGLGIAAYIIAALIMPLNDEYDGYSRANKDDNNDYE